MGYTTGQFISFIRRTISDALNRQNTAAVIRGAFEKVGTDYFNKESDKLPINQVEGLEAALGNGGYAFTNIAQNQVGTHPAFTAQHPLNLYLLARANGTPGAGQIVVTVSAQRQAEIISFPTGDVFSDYEWQFRAGPTIGSTRSADVSTMLADGETLSDYEYQIR